MKVARDKSQTTTIQFKDGDKKVTTCYFKFDHVVATFKPLS